MNIEDPTKGVGAPHKPESGCVENPEDSDSKKAAPETGEGIEASGDITKEDIEDKKEQMRAAAEEWIQGQEKLLEDQMRGRLQQFENIGSGLGVALFLGADIFVAGDTNPIRMLIGSSIAGWIGKALGNVAGEITNYFERKKSKLNEQKAEIERKIQGKPSTFEEVKDSLDQINNK